MPSGGFGIWSIVVEPRRLDRWHGESSDLPAFLRASACPGEMASGSPIKDMRQHGNLQRFPRDDAWSVIHYGWEAL